MTCSQSTRSIVPYDQVCARLSDVLELLGWVLLLHRRDLRDISRFLSFSLMAVRETYENYTVSTNEQHLQITLVHLESQLASAPGCTSAIIQLTRVGSACPSSVTSTTCIDSSACDSTTFMCASYAYQRDQLTACGPKSAKTTDGSHAARRILSCLLGA
jgi:hypothetical protein